MGSSRKCRVAARERKRGRLPLLLAGLLAAYGPTAVSAGPYNGGPGGPILVVTNSANPFAEYYAEILLAEGLNEFALTNIASVSSSTLANYDVVILGQMGLSAAQVTTLSNWVNAGGHLIAMRPDKQLAGLLGLIDVGTTISEGYLLVNTSNGPGVGIVGESMQFHGTADCYIPGDAGALALLYSNALTATANPAVTLRGVGSNGGQAAAFTFDLARSIVYMRQGNPAWAGQERDGNPPMRPDDMFFGAKPGDMQPDWIDLTKVAIPQADEQQRLLANMILSMDAGRNLLPRFWYFPHGYKAVLVMTGDDHAGTYGGSYATARFDQYLAASSPAGSVQNWEVPRCTAYVFTSPSPCLTNDSQAAAYQAAGFEIGMHLNTGCLDYTPAALTSFFSNQMSQFRAKYPSLAPQATHRIHCIAWSGYTIPAEISLQFGIRLDTSYYYWPSNWITDRPGMFTGSGMPMRFATTNGAILDIYQATTQMTDESGQTYSYTADTLFDAALGPKGYYGAFVANMHTDVAAEPDADATYASAQIRGVPIISARQLLTWVDARNQSSIGNIMWTGGKQTFSVLADGSAWGLQAMAPIPVGYAVTNVTRNGAPTGYYVQRIKGTSYAFFPATNGNYEVSYSPDTMPPNVTSVSPAAGTLNVGMGTKLSAAFSEPIIGINPNTFILRDSFHNRVPASVSYDDSTFTATLTPASPLGAATTYTATVKGGAGGVSDLATNVLTNDFVWTFATESRPFCTLGNTNNGSLSDNLWDTGPSINAARFQAAFSSTVFTLRAKTVSIAGRHKCAIYSDTSGKPARLLGSTLELTNTDDGWQIFPLTSAVKLSIGNYYWLAIWSDDPGARAYYSAASGTLRWEDTGYGAWPDPINTTGGSTLSYCIYAAGTPLPMPTNQTVVMLENSTTNLTLSGWSPDGAPITFGISSNPTNGVLGKFNPGTGAVSYSPNRDYYGADTFQFTVSNTNGQATGTVNLTISMVNHAPTLTFASNNVVVLENSGPVTVPGFAQTTVGPPNESWQSITNIQVLNVANAALFAVGPAISPGGTLTFTPAAYSNGLAVVTAQAFDNGGTANGGTNRSDAKVFTITVTAVNYAPIANSDSYNLGGGATLVIPAPGVLGNDTDADGDALTAILTRGPLQGTLNLAPDGGFNYSPTNHFNGLDTFTYQASDGQTNSNPATVSIAVSNQIQISSIALSNGIVTLTWNSIAGKNYRLQCKDNLTDAGWQDLPTDVSATGLSTTGTNIAGAATQRFYRVLCLGSQP
jgi:hypothetical protein